VDVNDLPVAYEESTRSEKGVTGQLARRRKATRKGYCDTKQKKGRILHKGIGKESRAPKVGDICYHLLQKGGKVFFTEMFLRKKKKGSTSSLSRT